MFANTEYCRFLKIKPDEWKESVEKKKGCCIVFDALLLIRPEFIVIESARQDSSRATKTC